MSLRTAAFCLLVLLPVAAPAATKPAAPAPVAPTAAAPKSPQPTTWESYRVLSERNIFLRNRSRPSSGRHGSGSEPPRPPVNTGDTSIVLTGIIRQGDDCVAFFEDTRTGKTTQFLAGAALGRGRLGLITEDTVHYACDGQLRKITIGSTLAGTVASFAKPASSTTTTAPAAPPARAPGTPPGPPGAVTLTTAPGTAPSGATPPPPEAPATATAGTATTQPPAAPPQAAASPPSGGTAASILEERMRQRREQELSK